MKPIIKGLTTGVGSLPYQTAEPALKLIWLDVPRIPHWPQLPMAGADEGFSVQYLQALIRLGLVKADNGLLFATDLPAWVERVTDFYSLYLEAQAGNREALNRFAFPAEAARGFYGFIEDLQQNGTRQAVYLKGQLSGPLTVGFQLTDSTKRASYYDSQLREILVKNLALHAVWQVNTLKQFGLPVLMMVDDPGLYAFGRSTHISLTREEIIDSLNEIYDAVKTTGGTVGTHVCAGMDWTLLFATGVQVVNFDAYEYFDSMKVYPRELKEFLERGGVLSWGIVPTSLKMLGESGNSLLERFQGYLAELEERGVAPELILSQSIFTPSCGTGTLAPELAERIYHTLAEFSSRVAEL